LRFRFIPACRLAGFQAGLQRNNAGNLLICFYYKKFLHFVGKYFNNLNCIKMKRKFVLVVIAICVGYLGQSQTNVEQALVNGCNDGTNARGGQIFGSTYYSVMNNPSISSEYKDAYQEAYTRCYSGGKFYWKKGVLVYEPPKNPKDQTIKPGIYD
jgi:hypothetical protein